MEVTCAQISTLSQGGGRKKLVLRAVLGLRGPLVLAGIHPSLRLQLLPQIQHRLIKIFHETLRSKEHLLKPHLHLCGASGAELKATEQHVQAEADEPVQHSCNQTTKAFCWLFSQWICLEPSLTRGGENPPDDSAEAHQELPEGHVLLGDRHHQRAGVVLHEDARDAVAARRVVDHPLLGEDSGKKAALRRQEVSTGRRRRSAGIYGSAHPLRHRKLVCVC